MFLLQVLILVSILMYPTTALVVSLTRKIRRSLRKTRKSASIKSKSKVEVEEARRGPIVLTRSFVLINLRRNSTEIIRQMEM